MGCFHLLYGNNGTTVDYSGYGIVGTVVNATWSRTGGKIGGAYHFNGNGSAGDYLRIPDFISIIMP